MPIQPINYAAIPLLRGPFQGLDFGEMLRQGMQLRHEPQKLLEERQRAELSNRLGQQQYQMQEARLPYAPELAQAEVEKMKADAEKARALAAMGGMQFPGGMGLVQGEERASNLWGPNDPRTLRAKNFNDLLAHVREMSGTPYAAKIRADNEKIMNDPNMSEDEKIRKVRLNEASLVKNSVIPGLEAQNTRAQITKKGFDELLKPDISRALTGYSGAAGGLLKMWDEADAQITGKVPKRLLDYEHAVSIAEATAMNLRAAIGESVQPERFNSILSMLDTIDIRRSPEQALKRLKSAAWFFDVEKGEIEKATGRVPEKSMQENMNVVKKDRQKAKAQNVKPAQKTQATPNVDWVWKGDKWVRKNG